MKKFSQLTPPLFARRFFEWWSKKADTEDLLGDIDEYYQINVKERGKLSAQFTYFKQILSLSSSYALKKRKMSASFSNYYSRNSFAMIKNYFKIALRNFSKHKLFTSINIVGLALGMSISLLALSLIVSVFQFDEFHVKKNRIFQINTHITEPDDKGLYGSTFNAVGEHMSEKYPFVEQVLKIKNGFNPEVKHQGNLLNFNGYFVDPSFFNVFSFQLISGNPVTALAEPFSVVLTKSAAEKLYRNENPIGKVIETERGSFNVTGVMEDLKQTHLYFEILTSFKTFEQLNPNTKLNSDWINYRNNYVYVLLKDEASKQVLEESLAQVAQKATEFNPDRKIELHATQVSDILPSWSISNALGMGWDLPSLLLFMAIGFLVLLPAVFNYTNLSIARALKRAKEIGVRKVVGAEKNQIKAQFLVETIVLSTLALAGSIFIFFLIKREFIDMVIGGEALDLSLNFSLVLIFILFAIAIGALSGLFPALYFSRLNPIATLKGDVKRAGSISGIKKGLFVFQFVLSLFFIIGVGAIGKQYTHVFSYNSGFTSDNILVVPFQSIDKLVAINELQNHPDVKEITSSSNLPGLRLPAQVEITPNENDTIAVSQVFIGENFVENLDMNIVWGESGNELKSTQNEELVLVNEQFMQSTSIFGHQKDSLIFTLANGTKCRIIGILKDFNFEPLNALIEPLVLRYSLEESNYALLTVNSADIKGTVDDLDAIWTAIDQKTVFEATFLDDEIEEAYFFLVVQIKIFGFLSALAITISCLGLLGMVSYTTENRTKEIAIRKIMGASIKSLYYTLTKDFLKLIMISALIAIPFSYFFYDMLFLNILIRYGQGLGILEIIVSITFLFLIGFAAIYWQTSKVAKANPAGNLRYE